MPQLQEDTFEAIKSEIAAEIAAREEVDEDMIREQIDQQARTIRDFLGRIVDAARRSSDGGDGREVVYADGGQQIGLRLRDGYYEFEGYGRISADSLESAIRRLRR